MSLRLESFQAAEPLPGAFAAVFLAQGYRQRDEALWLGAEAAIAWQGTEAVGRISWSLAPGLRGLEKKAGIFGHFEAADAEAAGVLLGHAAQRLRELGAEIAVGPMNGSTWHRYRLALPGSEAAFFPGEPENQLRYASHLEAAGFRVLENYESRRTDLSASDGQEALPTKVRERWDGRSRSLRLDRYEEELGVIADLSLQAFDSAVLYTPVQREEILALYRPLKALYDPDLIRLVEDESGELCAYMVAYPDGPRVILKTLACRADVRGSGLGAWLIADAQRVARAKGCREAIHALMHVDNRSASLSKRWSEPFRRYALYARDLA